ncbi:MAG: FtsX-like permease family protein [Bdellovibrionia bacterium]
MILKLAARNLLRNPRRTTAILLTVAMGSSSLFIFNGFNKSLLDSYRENTLRSRYGNGQINTAGYRDKTYEKPWEHWMTDTKPLQERLLKIPGLDYVFPRIHFYALLTNGKINVAGTGEGIDAMQESKFFTSLNIEEGKNLESEPDGIIIGKGLAHSLDAKVGDRVTVLTTTVNGSMNGADFTVTGIFHTGNAEFDNAVFRIPLKQAQTLLDTDRIETMALGFGPDLEFPEVAKVVQNEFKELEATPFEILDKIFYQNSVDWLDSQFNIIQTIILSIVVLGIFNTVSSGILERKQEIGNLRANGESSNDVLALLVAEGTVMGLLGAALGLAFALIVNKIIIRDGILMPPAPGITRTFVVPIMFTAKAGLKSFGWAAFTAIIGTTLAALKAVRITIAEALRST